MTSELLGEYSLLIQNNGDTSFQEPLMKAEIKTERDKIEVMHMLFKTYDMVNKKTKNLNLALDSLKADVRKFFGNEYLDENFVAELFVHDYTEHSNQTIEQSKTTILSIYNQINKMDKLPITQYLLAIILVHLLTSSELIYDMEYIEIGRKCIDVINKANPEDYKNIILLG